MKTILKLLHRLGDSKLFWASQILLWMINVVVDSMHYKTGNVIVDLSFVAMGVFFFYIARRK